MPKSIKPNSIKDRKKQELVAFCKEPRTRSEMMEHIELTDIRHFRTDYLIPLQKDGLIRKVDLEKPTSRYQKYISI